MIKWRIWGTPRCLSYRGPYAAFRNVVGGLVISGEESDGCWSGGCIDSSLEKQRKQFINGGLSISRDACRILLRSNQNKVVSPGIFNTIHYTLLEGYSLGVRVIRNANIGRSLGQRVESERSIRSNPGNPERLTTGLRTMTGSVRPKIRMERKCNCVFKNTKGKEKALCLCTSAFLGKDMPAIARVLSSSKK